VRDSLGTLHLNIHLFTIPVYSDAFVAPMDSIQNARSVRQDTAELATYLLSDPKTQQNSSVLQRARVSYQDSIDSEVVDDSSTAENPRSSKTILEVSEPPSPDGQEDDLDADAGPSVLANLLKRSPPQSIAPDQPSVQHEDDHVDDHQAEQEQRRVSHTEDATEQTPLLTRITSNGRRSYSDLEGQKSQAKSSWFNGFVEVGHRMEERVSVAINPKKWDRQALWKNAVLTPTSCLPAVAVGLLLNILDALSYGMFHGLLTLQGN
jgi:SulP family sulfate permease